MMWGTAQKSCCSDSKSTEADRARVSCVRVTRSPPSVRPTVRARMAPKPDMYLADSETPLPPPPLALGLNQHSKEAKKCAVRVIPQHSTSGAPQLRQPAALCATTWRTHLQSLSLLRSSAASAAAVKSRERIYPSIPPPPRAHKCVWRDNGATVVLGRWEEGHCFCCGA